MNRKQRRAVAKDRTKRKQHEAARNLVDKFLNDLEETESEITESYYKEMYAETEKKWKVFAKFNNFNEKYFHDMFKIDFKKLKDIEPFNKMEVPEIVDFMITNYRKNRDKKKQPYRRPVGPTMSKPVEAK